MTVPGPEELLAVARIVRPHGVAGEASADVLSPPVLDAADLLTGRVFARFPQGKVVPMQVIGLRPHGARLLIRLEGIETMDQAETLRQVDLCLPRAELPELPEGWFWEADLQLCRVFDRALGEIGAVHALNTSGPRPQLEIKRPDNTIAQIPWVKAYIVSVDIA